MLAQGCEIMLCSQHSIIVRTDDMKLGAVALGAVMLGLFSMPALADGYPAIPLFSGNKTVMDEEIAWPTDGKAHVNSLIVVLAPGERTLVHKHGVPTFIHILEGEVTVDYEGHGKRTYRQGDGCVAFRPEHRKGAGEDPCRLHGLRRHQGCGQAAVARASATTASGQARRRRGGADNGCRRTR